MRFRFSEDGAGDGDDENLLAIRGVAGAGVGVGELALAALEVAFLSRLKPRAFPGALSLWGAFFSLDCFGRGHSRSRDSTRRDPETHSSKRLLNESQ